MKRNRLLKPLRVGFVPLIDAAPLIMARELGLYERYGLRVQLSRELGWATIRDKVIFGQLEAAHALAVMPFATTFGQGCVACDCVTGLVLNLNGNGITLSNELREMGVRDALTFRKVIDLHRGSRVFALGVVFPGSTHHHLLREWLMNGGINPDTDVHLVVVPAPSMLSNLRNRNLDGYCVGEPWNSAAVRADLGWLAATSLQLAPRHPEKVLMVRRDFAGQHPEEHLALIAALLDACRWCDAPANREELARVLSRRHHVNAPFETLRESLCDEIECGGARKGPRADFHIFHQGDANRPTPQKAAWVMKHLLRLGADAPVSMPSPSAISRIFRDDIYQAAGELAREGGAETEKVLPSGGSEAEPEAVYC
jgi:ABC-type nitrate/sulfonate/bicarbonate transport system substrate-binding protein